MKIAIILCGQLRNLNLDSDNLVTNLFDELRPDLYINSWDVGYHPTQSNGIYHNGCQYIGDWLITDNPLALVPTNLLPYLKDITIESFDKWLSNCKIGYMLDVPEEDSKHKYIRRNINIPAMFYKNFVGIQQILKTGIKYDIIFKLRSELKFGIKLSESIFSNLVDEPKKIGLLNGHEEGGYCDWIAFGSPEAMNYYSRLYPEMFHIDERLIHKQDRDFPTYNAEVLLKHWLKMAPITVYKYNIPASIRNTRINIPLYDED